MQRTLPEKEPQNWRVLAVSPNKQHLITLGKTITQVRAKYKEAIISVLTPDERLAIKKICIQRWKGMPDRGKWHTEVTEEPPAIAAAS